MTDDNGQDVRIFFHYLQELPTRSVLQSLRIENAKSKILNISNQFFPSDYYLFQSSVADLLQNYCGGMRLKQKMALYGIRNYILHD